MLTSSPARQPPPGARTLYLAGGGAARVHATEQALVVTTTRVQTLRYPVQRVARIVTSPTVDWSGPALSLCQRHAISICWLDALGEPLGTLFPQRRGNLDFATALDVMLEQADGAARYANWLRSRRMDVLLRWGQSSQTAICPRQWENTKRQWVYGGRIDAHLPPMLRGHCMAVVARQFALDGLMPIGQAADGGTIHLDQDICELLWAEMNLCCGTLGDNPQGDAAAVALFEAWQSRNRCALVLHLANLQRCAFKSLLP